MDFKIGRSMDQVFHVRRCTEIGGAICNYSNSIHVTRDRLRNM